MNIFCSNCSLSVRQHLPFRENDIKQQLQLSFSEIWLRCEEEDATEVIRSILEVLKPEYRKYLSVFDFKHNPSLTNTIFKAMEAGKTICISFAHSIKR
jgi:hypothetical protein